MWEAVTSLHPRPFGLPWAWPEVAGHPEGERPSNAPGPRDAQRSRPPCRPQASPPAPPSGPGEGHPATGHPGPPRLPPASPYQPSSQDPLSSPIPQRGRFSRLPPTPRPTPAGPSEALDGPRPWAALGRPPAQADESTLLGTRGSRGRPGLAAPDPAHPQPPCAPVPRRAGEALSWGPARVSGQPGTQGAV